MNENNQPQSQQTKRELTFKAGDLCMAWHYNQYDKVDLFYCRLESVGYEYATGELFYNEEMTRKAGRRKDICVADLMPWSEAGKANKQPSESSHSPTEQPGDAKHTPGPWLHSRASVYIKRENDNDLWVAECRTYDDAAFIARAPDLLSEVSTLRSKQAKLVAWNQKLREYITAEREISQRFTDENAKLRSERDKMREALEVSKKALYQIVDDARLKGVKYTAKAFGLVNGAYVKVESALSGGSK